MYWMILSSARWSLPTKTPTSSREETKKRQKVRVPQHSMELGFSFGQIPFSTPLRITKLVFNLPSRFWFASRFDVLPAGRPLRARSTPRCNVSFSNSRNSGQTPLEVPNDSDRAQPCRALNFFIAIPFTASLQLLPPSLCSAARRQTPTFLHWRVANARNCPCILQIGGRFCLCTAAARSAGRSS